MDIQLQNTPTAPLKVPQQPAIGAVTKPQEQQNAANITGTPTTPAELGTVGAVNVSRISGQSPALPEISGPERILKPYGVTMLPRSENTEKLV
jgi:hypothetical protein